MKIGIFDSGIGGLITMKGIVKQLPEYDYVYLGDTKHVPYGNRSQVVIYSFTERAIKFLFEQDCQLVIVACNTASTEALRKIQMEFLPKHYADRRVLGVIIPAVEVAVEAGGNRIGIIGTNATIASKAFVRELQKIKSDLTIFQTATPLLAPMIENGGLKWLKPILQSYLRPLLAKKIDTLILGCTHYAILKNLIRRIIGPKIKIISQDEIVPLKLVDYLKRHPEVDSKLSKKSQQTFFATDITDALADLTEQWFGVNAKLLSPIHFV